MNTGALWAQLLTSPGNILILQEKHGGRTWARTKDPLIKSQLLYQLSYASPLLGMPV